MTEPRPETAPVSRERIAAQRALSGTTPFVQVPDAEYDALLAAAEWGWAEHDRAEALAAEVERLRCAHCGEVGCDWIGDIRKARAEAAEAALLDARAEVERLRKPHQSCEACGCDGCEYCTDESLYAERDAARASLAALIADLRALETHSGGEDYEHNESCGWGHGGAPECPRCWWLTIAAVIARHGGEGS